jgi:hypothetical protein
MYSVIHFFPVFHIIKRGVFGRNLVKKRRPRRALGIFQLFLMTEGRTNVVIFVIALVNICREIAKSGV